MGAKFYLCDGDVKECNKNSCYKKGGPCRYTSKILNSISYKNGKEIKFEEGLNGIYLFEIEDS